MIKYYQMVTYTYMYVTSNSVDKRQISLPQIKTRCTLSKLRNYTPLLKFYCSSFSLSESNWCTTFLKWPWTCTIDQIPRSGHIFRSQAIYVSKSSLFSITRYGQDRIYAFFDNDLELAQTTLSQFMTHLQIISNLCMK